MVSDTAGRDGSSAGGRALSQTQTKEDYDLQRSNTGFRTIGRLKLRGKTDDLPQSWWFASTAIPLIAATIGPLANILSIAAIVSKWRDALPNNGQLPEGADENGVGIPDPTWEVALNACSLVCGFIGNFFLLLNFTKRIRYIIALPMSIIFWFIATGILIGIVIAMQVFTPPIRPGETYSQGYWHAVIAAVLYMIGSTILMINMLGYFLGKYPQHFDLDDDQRTLILQTMMFFFWLAGGAAVFQKVCGWSYADALYFCDVTVLTVGFGDFVGTDDVARGLVFPYSVGGIIFLGLMINSIRKFAISTSTDNLIKTHERRQRERTIGRSVTSEKELRDKLGLPPRRPSDFRRASSEITRPSQTRKQSGQSENRRRRSSLSRYGHFDIQGRQITFHEHKVPVHTSDGSEGGRTFRTSALVRGENHTRSHTRSERGEHSERSQKLLLLKDEKDRFETMREIQQNTKKFRQYTSLAMSVLAFGFLWCIGALVFMIAEHREQNLSYFEGLYFCYVSLLTIGYGDFAPKSNSGKPFFVVWSLIAIPTMTILISDMSDTVVSAINRGTFTLADWTIMPKEGAWRDFLESHPKLKTWLENYTKSREEKKRLKRGFEITDPDQDVEEGSVVDSTNRPTLEQLAEESTSEHELARRLAIAIKRVAQDLHADGPKKYTYEEWVEFTRLIKFSARSREDLETEEEEEGLIDWDWIGEDSPMLSDQGEPQWVLDRLCESLNRYTRKQARNASTNHLGHRGRHLRHSSPDPNDKEDPSEEEKSGAPSNSTNTAVEDEKDPRDAHKEAMRLARIEGIDHHAKNLRRRKENGQAEANNDVPDKREELRRMHKQTESQGVAEWERRIAAEREQKRAEMETA